jgi:hypothetical protein
MEVSGHLKAPTALPQEKQTHGTYWTRGRVGIRASQEAVLPLPTNETWFLAHSARRLKYPFWLCVVMVIYLLHCDVFPHRHIGVLSLDMKLNSLLSIEQGSSDAEYVVKQMKSCDIYESGTPTRIEGV